MFTQPSGPADPTVAPKACPFCKSLKVTTTSKAVNLSTYWRRTSCGQIWNASRLPHGGRPPYGRFS